MNVFVQLMVVIWSLNIPTESAGSFSSQAAEFSWKRPQSLSLS